MDKDNPPAFPVVGHTMVHATGLSLRDYFAGQVLAGATANTETGDISMSSLALGAYEFADAMLAARKVNTQ